MVPAKSESVGFVQLKITWPSPGVALKLETSAGGVVSGPTLYVTTNLPKSACPVEFLHVFNWGLEVKWVKVVLLKAK
jgi:hypothetical protein